MKWRDLQALWCLAFTCVFLQCEGQERSARYLSGIETGSSDGKSSEVRFTTPLALVVDGGFLYVYDGGARAVRRIDLATREVTTVLGPVASPSPVESLLPFASDRQGSLYLGGASVVRRLDLASGISGPLAGRTSTTPVDGWGFDAMFRSTAAFAWEGGALYVVSRNAIRRVEVPSGRTSTVAGREDGFGYHSDGPAELSQFDAPTGLVGDGLGNLYVADSGNRVIRRIDLAARRVSTVAGSPGVSGTTDGIGAQARFGAMGTIAIDPAGHLYVAEPGGPVVRRIEAGTRRVTTHAGRRGVQGNSDGTRTTATFVVPTGLACDTAGNVYVSDPGSASVRRIDTQGTVTTFAGPESRVILERLVLTPGDAFVVAGLAASPAGLYLLDARAHGVKELRLPSGEIASIAGNGLAGAADGAGLTATFQNERTLRASGGYLYSQQDGKLRRISPVNGEVITYPFPVSATFVIDGDSVVWKDANGVVKRTTLSTGQTTTLGSAPPDIRALALGPSGRLFASAGSVGTKVLELDGVTGLPTLFAGSDVPGYADGFGTEARFVGLDDLCFDGDRSLYGIDFVSTGSFQSVRRIRRIDLLTREVKGAATLPDATRIASDGAGGLFASTERAVFEILPLLPDQPSVDFPTGPVGQPRLIEVAPLTGRSPIYRFSRRPSRSSSDFVALTGDRALLTPDVADRYDVEVVSTSPAGGYRKSVLAITATETRCVPATVTVTPAGAGTFIAPGIDSCPAGSVPAGREMGLDAFAAPGFTFAGWVVTSGWCVVLGAMRSSTTFVAASPTTFEARFVPETACHPLALINAVAVSAGNCRLSSSLLGFTPGSTVRVAPTTEGANSFAYWKASGARATRSGEPAAEFEVLGPAVIEAVFASEPPRPETGSVFYTLTPCRLVDSRDEAPPSLAGERRAFALSGLCGIPASARAVSVNVTSLDATGTGELKVFAAGSASSPPAVIPVRPGPARAVGAFVRLSTDGGRAVIVETANGSGTAHFILDVNGYWQ